MRLRCTEMLVELDALLNDLVDLPIEPSDWLAGEPKMDSLDGQRWSRCRPHGP